MTNLTLDILNSCEYQQVISDSESEIHQYCIALGKASLIASKNKEHEKEIALKFLSNICSLQLNSKDMEKPFSPFIILSNNTASTTLADFSDDDANLLSALAPNVKNPELAARIADLAWTIKKNGHFSTIIIAINNYINSVDSIYCQKNWPARLARLERALRLSKKINEASLIDIIKNKLLELIEPQHKLFSLIACEEIFSLLLEFELLDPILIAEKIEHIINSCPTIFEIQYILLSIASKAFLKGKKEKEAEATKLKAAEALVSKAQLSSKQVGQIIVTSHFYSRAISALQQCKGQQQRIAQLQPEFAEVILESQKVMQYFSTSVDITIPIHETIAVMKNKDLPQALLQFAYLSSSPSRKSLEDQAIDIAKQYHFQSTAIKRIQNGEGRLVAIIQPLLTSKDEDYATSLKWGAYQQALYRQFFVVQTVILPAINVITNEHHINKKNLAAFIDYSSFLLATRKSLWVKGFLAGFHNEFDVALSLLIPQFEHALRKYLEKQGAVIWKIDPATKIHSEVLLPDLLRMKETKELFGEDLQFELLALLTDRIGANLRNEFAHGFMSESDFNSVPAIYLWWLLFRIVVITFNQQNTQQSIIKIETKEETNTELE
jgi:hypothetical protein